MAPEVEDVVPEVDSGEDFAADIPETPTPPVAFPELSPRQCLEAAFQNGTTHFEANVHTEHGEDGILAKILDCVGTENRYDPAASVYTVHCPTSGQLCLRMRITEFLH